MAVAPELVFLFQALPRPYLLLSPELVIEAASEAYLHATLTRREHLIGQYLFDAFPDNPRTPEAQAVHNLHASLHQVLATGQPHEMAPQHYDVPGPERPGQFVERHWQPLNSPVLDAQGRVVHLIHSVRDVTAEVQAQARLRESQAREQAAWAKTERQRGEWQRVFAQAPVAMGLLRGPDFVVEWANARMGQLWGRPVAQVVGRPHFEALPDLADVLQTGQPRFYEELLVRFDQAQLSYQGYFNISYQPVYEGPEHITGILCAAYDVTEQVLARRQVEQLNHELEMRVQARPHEAQRARAHAEEQRQRLERLFEQAPAAICILSGPELVYELVNPRYQQFFPERPLLGKPLLDALPELTDHAAYHTMRQVFETGETLWQQALHTPLARTPDGKLEDRYFNYI